MCYYQLKTKIVSPINYNIYHQSMKAFLSLRSGAVRFYKLSTRVVVMSLGVLSVLLPIKNINCESHKLQYLSSKHEGFPFFKEWSCQLL